MKPYVSEHRHRLVGEHVKWKAIGRALGRVPHDCNDKWHTLTSRKKSKRGAFSEEEDALILNSVKAWEEKYGPKLGIWPQLQKEMNRPSATITRRWNALLKKKEKMLRKQQQLKPT